MLPCSHSEIYATHNLKKISQLKAKPTLDYVRAIILGVIEGITEFLPISSTGHLLIAEQWLGQRSDTFNIVIQSGAMLAVTIIYWPRLMELALGWHSRGTRSYFGKLALAFILTASLGFAAKRAGLSLPESVVPVAWALIVGGVWIMIAERLAVRYRPNNHVSWIAAVLVGLAQVVAGVFPGTSRSAATIFAAMAAGTTDRRAATDFAFLVGIPTMYAASAFELLAAAKNTGVQEDWAALGLAFATALVTAFIAVKWLLGFIKTHAFTGFAIYRLVLGALLLGCVAMGWVR